MEKLELTKQQLQNANFNLQMLIMKYQTIKHTTGFNKQQKKTWREVNRFFKAPQNKNLNAFESLIAFQKIIEINEGKVD